jgi:hypothetical protein
MAQDSNAPRWEIDSIFSGGAASPQFADFRKKIADEIEKLTSTLESQVDPESAGKL